MAVSFITYMNRKALKTINSDKIECKMCKFQGDVLLEYFYTDNNVNLD